ncbi:hypothetical protein [Methanobrevibacter sp.]|uniref:hypothetical protein n=1 Tax=Methanobrevibacter sp. TaxID=66852 RepID=UPI00388F94F8
MTTELIAMNGNAIAIAVDSAVTVNRQKTAFGFTKLFPIEKIPMAIMLYGSSYFENIPMENLIAEFIQKTNFNEVNTVLKIKNSFLEFLSKNTLHHDFKSDIEYRFNIFKKEIIEYFSNLNEDKINFVIKKYLKLELPNFIKQLDEYNQYDFLFKELKSIIGTGKWKAFKNYFFYKFCTSVTGIVIVGFDEGKNFPSYINIDILLNNGGYIEYVNEKSKFSYSNNLIIPFAQTDVIYGYLYGIHPEFLDVIGHYHKSVLSGFLDEFIEYIDFENNLVPGNINAILKKVDDFRDEINTKNREFIAFIESVEKIILNNILYSMDLLSKENLANMVEILVKITSLRYQLSMNLNIVGGEVNVAVISKLDGFVWIKKEEYYDKKLNA